MGCSTVNTVVVIRVSTIYYYYITNCYNTTFGRSFGFPSRNCSSEMFMFIVPPNNEMKYRLCLPPVVLTGCCADL